MEQEKNIAAVGETGFVDFARRIYPFLELRPFHAAYYRLLEAFAAGRIRKLMISVPPQHGKSVGASTLLPAYILGLDPDRSIYAMYATRYVPRSFLIDADGKIIMSAVEYETDYLDVIAEEIEKYLRKIG